MAESRSAASHDSIPVTAISVESCIWAVRESPSRALSVPLAMVPEMVRSCPAVMTSGASESTETVTWPSIICAVDGGVVAVCAAIGGAGTWAVGMAVGMAGTADAAAAAPVPGAGPTSAMEAATAAARTTIGCARERRG